MVFLLPEGGPGTEPPKPVKKIEIDFGILKNPLLNQLQLMEEIKPVEETEIGRENPFTPF